jgi:P4 family phage/plasmid primase-like protien
MEYAAPAMNDFIRLMAPPKEKVLAATAKTSKKYHPENVMIVTPSETRYAPRLQRPAEPALTWSMFASVQSTKSCKVHKNTWSELVEQVKKPKRYANKADQPLIKLATFGDRPNAKGSVRHDGNVDQVYGLECDYDAGEVTPEQAATLLEQAGIRAVIYPSASHTVAVPRWRVLAPFQWPVAPADRAKYLSMLNGVLGGILAPESWVLSQTYYLGAVEGVEYQAIEVEGECIDLVADVDGLVELPPTAKVKPAVELLKARSAADINDPVADFLFAQGWVQGVGADGLLHGDCPWSDQHTTASVESATSYIPSGVGGRDAPGFKCMHSHCASRTVSHFLHAIGYEAAQFEDISGDEVDSAEQEAIRERNAKLEEGDKVDFTDAGNVNLLARLTHGDLRYVHEFKLWLNWTGERWEQDPTHTVAYASARRVGDHYAAQAWRLKKQIETADPSMVKGLQKQLAAVQAHEKACRSRRGMENMLALAVKDGRFVIMAERLDRDPYMLGVQNGVVDLRTGELRPDARDEFVTMRCNVAFHADAPAPRFRQLVDEVTGFPIEPEHHADGSVVASTVGRYTPRPDLAAYLQKALGYSISAVTREQKLFTTFGADGSNGKNQLLEAVLNTVGPYGVRARPSLLMTNRRSEQDVNAATPALKALEHKRLVVLSEPDANCIIDNGILKAITGDKEISGRAMYGAETNILVTFHLWMLANVKPPLDHMEPAVVGRIAMLPFDRSWNRPGTVQRNAAIPDGDPLLAETLQNEREGTLAWLVEGAAAYFREGLAPCAEVRSITVDYLNDQDPVARWLELYDTCAPQGGTSASDLYQQFSEWWEAEVFSDSGGSGHAPKNAKAFGFALKAKGVARDRTRITMYGLRQKRGEGRS